MRPRVSTPSNQVQSICSASLDQLGVARPGLHADLHQPHRVGGIPRTHHQQQIAAVRERHHRFLPVGRGVADVFLVRRGDVWEALAAAPRPSPAVSSSDSVVWVTKARLVGSRGVKARGLLHRSRPASPRPAGNWPMVPTTSGWPAWPISTISRPSREVPLRLHVDLGHQRAGGVEDDHLAVPRLVGHRLGHAVGGEHHRPVGRALVQLLDEHRALGPSDSTTRRLCTISWRT